MKCKIEFELDNAAFHRKGYCNSREEKETLDLPEVGRVVCGVGNKIARRCHRQNQMRKGVSYAVLVWRSTD